MRGFRDNQLLVGNFQFIEECHVRQVVLVVKPFRTDMDENLEWWFWIGSITASQVIGVVSASKLERLTPLVTTRLIG